MSKKNYVPTLVRMPKELQLKYKQYKQTYARKSSLNDVYVGVLENFFSEDEADKREAAVAKRFDRTERYLKLLLKQIEILTEMVALFIRGYLTTSPELPDDQKAAAAAQAGRRWMTFMNILVGKISAGATLLKDLQEDKIFTPEDFEQKIDEITGDINKYEAK